MSRTRTAAIVVFGLRIAYGAALLAAPDKVTKRWLGPGRSAADRARNAVSARSFCRGRAFCPLVLMPVRGWRRQTEALNPGKANLCLKQVS